LLLVSTLFVTWTRTGNGSLTSGFGLAERLAADEQTVGAIAVYGVAIVGGLVVALSGVSGIVARAARGTLALSALGLLWALADGGVAPPDRWGVAPFVVALGSLAVLAAEIVSRERR
jgi:hypothetical protein